MTALYRFPRSIGPQYNGAAVYEYFWRQVTLGLQDTYATVML